MLFVIAYLQLRSFWVKTNHFSKQQCADTYEFSVVYKGYFLRLYSLSAKYVSVHIYVDSHIFGLYIAQNYTVLKLFQFIYGILSDDHCCQWSMIAIM